MTKAPKIRKNIAAIAYGMTALASLILGLVYLVKGSFMPYHDGALPESWAELGANTQVLILALMRVAGGGWIAMTFIITILLVKPFQADEQWALYALPLIILLFYIPNLWATLSVAIQTPGNAPWYGNAISCLAAIVGFIVYPKPLENSKG